jgi:hypothetical protein
VSPFVLCKGKITGVANFTIRHTKEDVTSRRVTSRHVTSRHVTSRHLLHSEMLVAGMDCGGGMRTELWKERVCWPSSWNKTWESYVHSMWTPEVSAAGRRSCPIAGYCTSNVGTCARTTPAAATSNISTQCVLCHRLDANRIGSVHWK